jgi:hypothetical protein
VGKERQLYALLDSRDFVIDKVVLHIIHIMKYSKSMIFIVIVLLLGAISLIIFLSDGEKAKIVDETRIVRDKRISRNGSEKVAQRGRKNARVRVKNVLKEKAETRSQTKKSLSRLQQFRYSKLVAL